MEKGHDIDAACGQLRLRTERELADIWGEVLGIPAPGVHANFFDLGGHSLLAVQVINKLKKKTGKALPLTALLEAPLDGSKPRVLGAT